MNDMKMRHKETCRRGENTGLKCGTRNAGLKNAKKISIDSKHNKKFELMLTKSAKAYSSSGSLV